MREPDHENQPAAYGFSLGEASFWGASGRCSYPFVQRPVIGRRVPNDSYKREGAAVSSGIYTDRVTTQ